MLVRNHRGVSSWMTKLTLVFLLWVAAVSAAVGQTPSTGQLSELEQLTNALVSADQGNSQAEVRGLAQKRRDLLLKLAAASPQDAFRFLLPAEVAANLPSNVRDLVESDSEEQGTLEVRVEDYPDGTHRTLFFLDTARERLQLYFAKDKPHHLLTGTLVRARGKRLDSALLLQSGSTSSATGTPALETEALASANTFGAQSTVVLLVNFQDNTAQPYTVATARNLVFTSLCVRVPAKQRLRLGGAGHGRRQSQRGLDQRHLQPAGGWPRNGPQLRPLSCALADLSGRHAGHQLQHRRIWRPLRDHGQLHRVAASTGPMALTPWALSISGCRLSPSLVGPA